MTDIEWLDFQFFFLFLYIFPLLYLYSFDICVVRKLMPFLTNFIEGLHCSKRDLEVIVLWNHTNVFNVFQIVYILMALSKANVIIRMQKKMCCPICYENKFRNFRLRFPLFTPDSIVTCGPKEELLHVDVWSEAGRVIVAENQDKQMINRDTKRPRCLGYATGSNRTSVIYTTKTSSDRESFWQFMIEKYSMCLSWTQKLMTRAGR